MEDSLFDALKVRKQLNTVEEMRNKIETLSASVAKQETIHEPDAYAPGDWTAVYRQWDAWTDVEELEEDLEKSREELSSIENRPSFKSHRHEHSEERRIFEMAEHEKIETCEKHRRLGNFLFREGILDKAAEQYQVAVNLYEYCFPNSDKDQQALDLIRQHCVCNLSLCFQRLGDMRKAAEMASKVINENGKNAKAFYRRAQAYRLLDEYELAAQDIQRTVELSPDSGASVRAEINALQRQRASALQNEKHFSRSMMQQQETRTKNTLYKRDVSAARVDDVEGQLLSLNSAIPLEPMLKHVPP